MADEGGEKTEMPTAKKLRDARQKGQVCTSRDVVSTALLVVLMYLAAMLSMMLVDDLEQLITFIGGCRGGRGGQFMPDWIPLHA